MTVWVTYFVNCSEKLTITSKYFRSPFGRPFVKWFALCYRSVVCLSCLSVTSVYCSQTVRWIKMKLGMKVGLSLGYIVLDGDSAPPPQRVTAPQFSADVCCGQMAGCIKMPLGTEVGLSPGDIVLDGDSSPKKGGQQTPTSRPILWPNSCMDQGATWYEGRSRPRPRCVRWGPSSSPSRKGHSPQLSAHVYCGQTVTHLSYC